MLRRDTALKSILALSVIGLIVAGYQTYEHYFITSTFCDLSATFSCSVVTGSRFGAFPPGSGIATAAWGVVWWAGLMALSSTALSGREWIENQDFYTFSYVVAGLGFVAYLVAVELYILPQEIGRTVICPLCTVQHVLIVVILPLSYILLEKPLKAYMADVFHRDG